MAEFGETRGAFWRGLPHNRPGQGLWILVALKPIYTETLLRETAEGIPDAGPILYPGGGHTPAGEHVGQDGFTIYEFGMRQ